MISLVLDELRVDEGKVTKQKERGKATSDRCTKSSNSTDEEYPGVPKRQPMREKLRGKDCQWPER
jgi:hypothetical protein